MDIMKQISQLCVFFSSLCVLVNVLHYDVVHGYPFSSGIKIWNNHIEVSAKTLRVNAGSRVSLRCDAIYSNKPSLRWYGPDRHWITGKGSRLRVEDSHSKRFLKFNIVRVKPIDEGVYICSGWFEADKRFHMKAIKLVVVNKITSPPTTTTATTTTAATTTTTVTTPRTTTLRRPRSTSEACGFRCGDGMCLESSYVCDTFPDCVDGSDEHQSICADKICAENMVACKSGDECVSADNRCDGVPHCQDGSDEAPELCYSSTVPGF